MGTILVSVVVITYNSASYILSGLESLKNQKYDNFEVIISDDCSSDNTVSICEDWLQKNKKYFKSYTIVTSNQNTGVAGNLNRGIKAANGEWIKTLSGDDKFLPNTLVDYVDFARKHAEVEIICGRFHIYGDNHQMVEFHKKFYSEYDYPKLDLDQKQQYRENLKGLFVPAPGLFYKKSLWKELNGFDEKYQFCEEDPFMYKVFKTNRKVYPLKKEVYGYQVRTNSLGREKDSKIINRNLMGRIQFYRDVRRAEMLKRGLFFHVIDEDLKYKMYEAKDEKKRVSYLTFKILYALSPLRYFASLKHRIYDLTHKS